MKKIILIIYMAYIHFFLLAFYIKDMCESHPSCYPSEFNLKKKIINIFTISDNILNIFLL